MAKYSTGGVGGDSGGACELCGAEGRELRTATVAGARLEVCEECAHHGEDADTGSEPSSEPNDRFGSSESAASTDGRIAVTSSDRAVRSRFSSRSVNRSRRSRAFRAFRA